MPEPSHWTYASFKPEDSLAQGDLIGRTDAVLSLFEQVHEYFCDPKYLAFSILTQSCDLERHDGECKIKYISLAVVRSLDSVLFDLLDSTCERIGEGAYTEESKEKARMLLTRVFNQNEQAAGLFYLHPDKDAGIDVESVVLLRVAITLCAQHYDLLRESRRGRLASEFRSKLGWLVGNLYGRVGTTDWSETASRRGELNALVKRYLDEPPPLPKACRIQVPPEVCPMWFRRSWVREAKKKNLALDKMNRTELKSAIESCKPPSPKEVALEQVAKVLRDVMPKISADQVEILKGRLDNSAAFTAAFKRANS